MPERRKKDRRAINRSDTWSEYANKVHKVAMDNRLDESITILAESTEVLKECERLIKKLMDMVGYEKASKTKS